MVATSAWRRPSGKSANANPSTAHRDLLCDLLDPRKPGRAWICMDQGGDVKYLPHGPRADQLVETLSAVVQRHWESAEQTSREPGPRQHLLADLRHRVVLDAVRFRAAVIDDNGSTRPNLGGPQSYYVALDFRFDFFLDEPLCYASLSVWSALPLHPRYRPWKGNEDSPDVPVVELENYRRVFDDIIDRTETKIGRHLSEPDFRVFERSYELPVFWVVVPAERELEPGDYLGRRGRLTNRLARVFLGLGHADDCVATSSVINGQFLVVRRFRHEEQEAGRKPERNRAHYLMVPGRAHSSPGISPKEAAQVQEDLTATVITHLTNLEARSANLLYDILSDLEIWQNHLDVYAAVVERAGFLWDALSTHLLTRRGRNLGRVHRAIEMLHQTLLQGVADLAHLATLTRECVARTDQAADQLREEYDDNLTEQHPREFDGLRASLVEIGLFERVRRRGSQTLEEADRVKAAYDALLRTIGYAFDERRVRESDALQNASATFSIFLALIGMVTVLDATIAMKPPANSNASTVLVDWSWLSVGGVWFSLLSGAVLLVVGVLLFVSVVNKAKLGSRRFRRRYDGRQWGVLRAGRGVWQFLKDTSTDHLDAVRRRGAADAHWKHLDDKLARQFARLWDDASQMRGTDRSNWLHLDIKAQTRRIEQWGLHSLLLTERARRMYRYRLPKLVSLYRCCTRLPGSFLSIADRPHEVTMIADNDFARSLRRVGVTWQDSLTVVDAWLRYRQPKTAEQVLSLLNELKLSAEMSKEDATTMVGTMRMHLPPRDGEPAPATENEHPAGSDPAASARDTARPSRSPVAH
jgi:hypothetical protein